MVIMVREVSNSLESNSLDFIERCQYDFNYGQVFEYSQKL